MTQHQRPKRRQLLWLRKLDSDQLHGLAHKLRGEFIHGTISDRQDWLLDQVFSELEYRHAHPGDFPTCHCALCDTSWETISLVLEELADAFDDGPF